jgi:hypothetical protein
MRQNGLSTAVIARDARALRDFGGGFSSVSSQVGP